MNQPVDRLMDAVRQLPSIPKSLQRVLQTLNDENAQLSAVVEPVEEDPALTAKVLRLSNTAHFGLRKQVASVEDAAILVGMESIRTLVMASGLIGQFNSISGLDMKRFWRISLLSAMLAKRLADESSQEVKPEIAYTAALMHGLGKLAMHKVFDFRESSPVEANASDPRAVASWEMDFIGFHHGEVSAEVVHHWQLPEEIVVALRFYPYPDRGVTPPLGRLVYVSVLLANWLEDQLELPEILDKLDVKLVKCAGLKLDAVTSHFEEWKDLREAADDIVS